MMEKIICSAICYQDLVLKWPEAISDRGRKVENVDYGVVICGHRHVHCIALLNAITGLKHSEIGSYTSGFLTNKNRFVDRIEGAKIALETKQIERLKYGNQLYSEDLY